MRILMVIGLSFALFSTTYAGSTADRIKPVGQVRVTTVNAPTTSRGGSNLAQGKAIYNKHCTICHSAGVAGAPKLGDAGAWQPRVAQGKATLYKHAKNGLNAMPPKGMCMDCSDEALKAAVDYMLKNSG